MEKEKSQLAKDLSHALYVCRLHDDLLELANDRDLRGRLTEKEYEMISKSHIKAVVLLACAIADSEAIKEATGQ